MTTSTAIPATEPHRPRSRLAALRRWLMLRLFVPLRQGRTARLRYAAVLDGQTVNLHAALPRSTRLPDRADVVLCRGRVRHLAEAHVYQGPDGELLMDAAILMGAELGGVPAGPGRWKLRLRTYTGPRKRSVALLLLEPPVPYEGPTRPMEASPVTGARHRVGRTVTGAARIVSSAPKPAVEVAKVHMSHAGVAVDFRVLGTRVDTPWAEFVAAGRRIRQPVHPLGPDTYRTEVPLDGMEPRSSRPEHWDVVLCQETGPPLRLGRRLHDVRNPRRVFAMRSMAMTPAGRTPMIVQPRYTPAGNLRVTCTRMPEAD
ncbi:hypothetical protein ABZ915_12535 [Streptomyces sp. NPDC046915]|uniref:hypothetical protein n=1 Tax=Streptomyces sp. NPDC046915 TaxID=3155257 RepID=UPI0033F6C9F9